MRITDLLDARSILLNASPKSKNEALDQIVDLMVKSEKINDKEAYRKQVYAREEESTTGIGEGIAIPHGKCDAVTKPGLAAAGALSMAFGCTLMAPHGGIFVFPVVGNAIMYLVALVAGTVISAVLLGVLKKKII